MNYALLHTQTCLFPSSQLNAICRCLSEKQLIDFATAGESPALSALPAPATLAETSDIRLFQGEHWSGIIRRDLAKIKNGRYHRNADASSFLLPWDDHFSQVGKYYCFMCLWIARRGHDHKCKRHHNTRSSSRGE